MKIIEQYAQGRISIGKAAEPLGKSVHDVRRLAVEKGIRTGATDDQQEKIQETMEKLLEK